MMKRIVVPSLILLVALAGFQFMKSSNQQTARGRVPPVALATPTAPDTSANSPQKQQDTKPQRNGSGNPIKEQRPAQSSNRSGESSDQVNSEQQNTAQTNSQANANPQNTARPNGGRPGRGGLRSGSLGRQAATSVEVMLAEPTSEPAMLNLFGIIEAQQTAILSATSAANVVTLSQVEGELVDNNQTLVILNAPSTVEQLRQRQSSLQELEARIRNEDLKHKNDLAALNIEQKLLLIAKNSVDRFSSLNSQQLSTSSDYESALRAYHSQLLSIQNRELTLAQFEDSHRQIQLQREQLQSQVRQSQQLVNDLTISAPFPSLVAKVYVKQGQQLRAGDPVVELYDAQSLALYVRVPMRYRLDQYDLSELKAIDYEGGEWIAESIRLVNESGAQRLTLKPTNQTALNTLPGSHVSLTLHYPSISGAVSIPSTALYDQQRIYTFNRGTISPLDVNIIGRTEKGYLVQNSQLSEQTRIITTRLKNPVTGMNVSLVNGGGRPQ